MPSEEALQHQDLNLEICTGEVLQQEELDLLASRVVRNPSNRPAEWSAFEAYLKNCHYDPGDIDKHRPYIRDRLFYHYHSDAILPADLTVEVPRATSHDRFGNPYLNRLDAGIEQMVWSRYMVRSWDEVRQYLIKSGHKSEEVDKYIDFIIDRFLKHHSNYASAKETALAPINSEQDMDTAGDKAGRNDNENGKPFRSGDTMAGNRSKHFKVAIFPPGQDTPFPLWAIESADGVARILAKHKDLGFERSATEVDVDWMPRQGYMPKQRGTFLIVPQQQEESLGVDLAIPSAWRHQMTPWVRIRTWFLTSLGNPPTPDPERDATEADSATPANSTFPRYLRRFASIFLAISVVSLIVSVILILLGLDRKHTVTRWGVQRLGWTPLQVGAHSPVAVLDAAPWPLTNTFTFNRPDV